MDMPSGSALIISEGQARNLLRSHPGDGLEAWIAEQLWEPREDGSWRVSADRDGWLFHIDGVPGQAVRVVARAPEAGPVTSWLLGP